MKPNVYQIRAKITTPTTKPFYMKGVVISKSETKAKSKVINELKNWAKKEGRPNVQVLIVESKKLRDDFIMQVTDKD